MELNAKWIGFLKEKDKAEILEDNAYSSSPCPYFRKEFVINGKIKKATIICSALGIYETYINGKRTDDVFFAPGWTDYRNIIQLQKKEVTEFLTEGKNCIGSIVADGWFSGCVGLVGRGVYGDFQRRFYCELEIVTEDGKIQKIYSDDSWKVSTGSILSADLLHGQTVDANAENDGFALPDYDDSAWEKVSCTDYNVETVVETCPPIRAKYLLFARLISEKGGYIYDFMQNFAGIPRVVLRAEKGAVIKFRYAEILDREGKLYVENLRQAKATDYYIAKGDGEETFEPHFTYHGFRYVEISVIRGKAEIIKLSAHALTNDLKETGKFNCSSGIINKFYQNVVWGQRSNFLSVPTDCPQRDERLGWTGDAQIFTRIAMYNSDCEEFYKKYLKDVHYSINEKNGAVYTIAPKVPAGDEGNNGWGDAITCIPYDLYLMYGDKETLIKYLPDMKNWVNYLVDQSVDYIRKPGYCNPGDWLNYNDVTDIRVFNTLYSAHSADLTAKVCHILGDNDEEYYRDIFNRYRNAFRSEFIGTDGKIYGDTQTSYVLAYTFGICSIEEVISHLVRRLEDRNMHLSTGFTGVRYVLNTLSDGGRSDLAYRIIGSTSFPSWGYQIINGATTIWERWDSLTRYYGAQMLADASMNSFNHYSLGSASEWLYSRVLGIRPTEEGAGFEKMIYAPCFDPMGEVNHASGYYESKHGKIESSWERTGDTILCVLKKPKEILADFKVDGGVEFEQDGKKVTVLAPDAEVTKIFCDLKKRD